MDKCDWREARPEWPRTKSLEDVLEKPLGTARRSRYIQAPPRPRKAPGGAPARRHGDARRGRSDPHHRRTRTEAGPGGQRLTADRRRMKNAHARNRLAHGPRGRTARGRLRRRWGRRLAGNAGRRRREGRDPPHRDDELHRLLNPFNYIEAQAYNAFIMIYPQLVQYKYEDGKYEFEGDWASRGRPRGRQGLDVQAPFPAGNGRTGQPLTAEDAAWTINTTVKFADGPDGRRGPLSSFVKEARAPTRPRSRSSTRPGRGTPSRSSSSSSSFRSTSTSRSRSGTARA